MTLPNYFLADLPVETSLNAGIITEACQTLKRNREHYLAERPTNSLIRTFSTVAQNWCDPQYPIRRLALGDGPRFSGFSRETLEQGIDHFFQGIHEQSLFGLIRQDLGHENRLDAMVADPTESQNGRAAIVAGPKLIAHLTGGVLPNPTFVSILLGFLAKSAQFVKCASGTSFLTRLFAHSIYEVEPKLGACLEIAEWKGGTSLLESALFAEVDCVTATGSDETLARIRPQLRPGTRFVGYGHRQSFGYIGREMLAGLTLQRLVARAAQDITAWNQLGCLSPQLFYVEHGGNVPAEKFAEMLAEALREIERVNPRGEVPVEISADVASRRSFYEVRSVHAPETTRLWCSEGSTAWTVVYEADPLFQPSCLHRFIYVKGVTDVAEALQGLEKIRGQVSTVGLAAAEEKKEKIATLFAQWGATRICRIGSMQNPSIAWRHDGRPALADLVTWTDWELE